jgi:chaperonin GroES
LRREPQGAKRSDARTLSVSSVPASAGDVDQRRAENTTMAKLKPLHDRVLVKRTEAGSTTKGGIVLPDSAKEKPKEGTVVAIGDGKLNEKGERIAFQVKVNDRVLFSSYAGTEVKLDGEEFLVMHEEDIVAILD